MKKTPLQTWQIEDADRLRRLWKDYAARNKVSQEAFAAANDLGSQGMMYQYLKPTTPLNLKAAIKFAAGLGCTINDFSPTIAASIASASKVTAPGLDMVKAKQPSPNTLVLSDTVVRNHTFISDSVKSTDGGTAPAARKVYVEVTQEELDILNALHLAPEETRRSILRALKQAPERIVEDVVERARQTVKKKIDRESDARVVRGNARSRSNR